MISVSLTVPALKIFTFLATSKTPHPTGNYQQGFHFQYHGYRVLCLLTAKMHLIIALNIFLHIPSEVAENGVNRI